MKQTVTGIGSGTHTLYWWAAQRPGYSQEEVLTVKVNGNCGRRKRLKISQRHSSSTVSNLRFASGSATIEFINSSSKNKALKRGDWSVFVDAPYIVKSGESDITMPYHPSDGSFQSVDVEFTPSSDVDIHAHQFYQHEPEGDRSVFIDAPSIEWDSQAGSCREQLRSEACRRRRLCARAVAHRYSEWRRHAAAAAPPSKCVPHKTLMS